MYKKMMLVGAAALPVMVGAVGTPEAKGLIDGFNIGSFSANVAFVSDYAFRGISQTNEAPAIQGGFDYAHDLWLDSDLIGFNLGLWGSNVNFTGTTESAEIDFYTSLGGEFMNFFYDAGFIYYWYPGASTELELEFFEARGTFGYDFSGYAQVSGSVNYSPDYFGDSGNAIYYQGNLDIPFSNFDVPVLRDITVGTMIGYQNVEENDIFGLPDYFTWGASASLDLGAIHSKMSGLSLDFMYTDTNIDDFQCGGGQICDTRFIGGISAAIGIGDDS